MIAILGVLAGLSVFCACVCRWVYCDLKKRTSVEDSRIGMSSRDLFITESMFNAVGRQVASAKNRVLQHDPRIAQLEQHYSVQEASK